MTFARGEHPSYIFKKDRSLKEQNLDYCESCFSVLTNKPMKKYHHFDVCTSCFDSLKAEANDGYRRSTPSLNDLIGINLKYKPVKATMRRKAK